MSATALWPSVVTVATGKVGPPPSWSPTEALLNLKDPLILSGPYCNGIGGIAGSQPYPTRHSFKIPTFHTAHR